MLKALYTEVQVDRKGIFMLPDLYIAFSAETICAGIADIGSRPYPKIRVFKRSGGDSY